MDTQWNIIKFFGFSFRMRKEPELNRTKILKLICLVFLFEYNYRNFDCAPNLVNSEVSVWGELQGIMIFQGIYVCKNVSELSFGV